MSASALLGACVEPPPPRSVEEFVQNPIMLEAALVRCAQNRAEMRYEAECVNAREAGEQIAAREEVTRREELEKQSERKRQAVRRAQEAAAIARRRTEEERRRQEETDYLALFGQLPPDAEPSGEDVAGGNVPIAVIPEPVESTAAGPDYRDPLDVPADGGADTPGDLEAVREELQRRYED
jgi:hypothetical protein